MDTLRNTQPTSCEVYTDLEPTLGERQRAVLTGLREFHVRRGCWPGSYELVRFMQDQQIGHVRDVNDVRPRLTELRDRTRSIVVNGPKRRCGVTKKTVLTWEIWSGRLF